MAEPYNLEDRTEEFARELRSILSAIINKHKGS